MTKPLERTVTLHFLDGTRLSLEFPEQAANSAGRKLKVAELLAANHLVIEAEGSVIVCPWAAVKYMTFNAPLLGKTLAEALPRHAFVGGRIRA